ncbi:MAG: hypothetical protein ROZ36_19420 [Thermincola sp.]|jgi:hypothetical protein|nr:hypothetical protein [Thermincola sp.]
MEAELKELEEKMKLTLNKLVETAELSAKLKKKYPEHNKRIETYWADFGKHFLSRVRKIEKEVDIDILSGYSLTSLFKLIK